MLFKVVQLFIYIVGFVGVSAVLVFYGNAWLLRNSKKYAECSPSTSFFEYQTIGSQSNAATGLSWGDFNNDGFDDLFVGSYPYSSASKTSRLFKNINGNFEDVTAMSGIPDIFASSGFFADYDNDRWLDLFIVRVVWKEYGAYTLPVSSIRVFRNKDGYFTEVTADLGFGDINAESWGGTFSFADFDNDGLLDAVVSFSGWRKRYIYETNNPALVREEQYGSSWKRFVRGENFIKDILKAEPALGVAMQKDFDLERFLEQEGYWFVSGQTVPGPIIPWHLRGNVLTIIPRIPGRIMIFKNTGSDFKRIADMRVSPESLLPEGNHQTSICVRPWNFLSERYYQPTAVDFNRDNLTDIFVAVDSGRNLLLENKGNFRFIDVSDQNGLAIYGSGMGVAAENINGVPHVVVSNKGRTYFFRQQGNEFVLEDYESPGRLVNGWGIAFIDANNDGMRDLYITAGYRDFPQERGTEIIAKKDIPARQSVFYQDDAKLDRFYRNINGTLVERSNQDVCVNDTNSMPLAVSDINNDGYDDFVIGGVKPGEKTGVALFRNKGGRNNFLRVRLEGVVSNSYGVGAELTVRTLRMTQTQTVRIGESFYSQHSTVKTFGLGDASGPVAIEVKWPSGIQQIFENVPVDSDTVIHETNGIRVFDS